MLSRQTWHTVVRRGREPAERIDASSHDLRHHAASQLIAAGCSPRALAASLGHKNVAETLNTYAHLWRDDEDLITAAIDAGLRKDVHEMCTTTRSG